MDLVSKDMMARQLARLGLLDSKSHLRNVVERGVSEGHWGSSVVGGRSRRSRRGRCRQRARIRNRWRIRLLTPVAVLFSKS